jgi:hypothetical protein
VMSNVKNTHNNMEERSFRQADTNVARNSVSMANASMLSEVGGDSMTASQLGPRRAAALEPIMSGISSSTLMARGGMSEHSSDDDDDDGESMMEQVRKYQERLKAKQKGGEGVIGKLQKADEVGLIPYTPGRETAQEQAAPQRKTIEVIGRNQTTKEPAVIVANKHVPVGILQRHEEADDAHDDTKDSHSRTVMEQVRAHQEQLKAQDVSRQRYVSEIEEEKDDDGEGDDEGEGFGGRDEEGDDVAGVMGILSEEQKKAEKLKRREKRRKKKEKRALKEVCVCVCVCSCVCVCVCV